MNAYKLADWINNGAPFGKYVTAKQAAEMLIQQADRIAELEKELAIVKQMHDAISLSSRKPVKQLSFKEIEDCWLNTINNRPANDNRPTYWHFYNAIIKKITE